VYVIDADDDRVAVIDLASAAMRGPVVVRPRASLIDHLLGLVSSPADAKDQSNSERRAIVSSDGRRLYVSGFRSDVVAGAVPQVTPLPLQMIDTADMTQLGRIDLASTDIAVSPDGRRLLAVTHRFEPSGWTGYELRLVDTERSTQIASIALEDRGHLIGFASGGDAAYVAAHVGWETTLLRRVALADLRVEQIRKIDHSVGELLFPTAR
jgi:DNA-binding beta-propeller fold protein YncE